MDPTLTPPTTDDVRRAKAFWDACRTGTGWDVVVDLGALGDLDEPIALFCISPHGLTVAVHADGLVWAIENGVVHFTKNAVARVHHPDPIGLFLAAQDPHNPPPPRVGRRLSVTPRSAATPPNARQLLALSGGAQGWSPWAAEGPDGGARAAAQDAVDGLLHAWCRSMDDPFWIPQMPEPDGRVWVDDAESTLARVCTQAVLASGTTHATIVWVSPDPNHFTFTTESLANIDAALLWARDVAMALTDAALRTGGAWAYTDRPPTRASSYELMDTDAVRLDPTHHTAHARVQATHAVHTALLALGAEGAALWARRTTLC